MRGRLGRRWGIDVLHSISMCHAWMPSRRFPLEHNSQIVPTQLRIDLHDYNLVITDVIHESGVTAGLQVS